MKKIYKINNERGTELFIGVFYDFEAAHILKGFKFDKSVGMYTRKNCAYSYFMIEK